MLDRDIVKAEYRSSILDMYLKSVNTGGSSI